MPAIHHVNAESQHTLENIIHRSERFDILPPYVLYNQSMIPFARNTIFEKFLASGADFCFQMDADISLRNPNQFDALDRLFETWDSFINVNTPVIVGGVYCVKNPPFNAACLTHERDSKPAIYESFFNKPAHFEIKYCATGFMLHDRDLALKIGMKPYNLLDHPERPGEQLSEDFSFCERAKRIGARCAVNTTLELYHTGNYYFSLRDQISLAKSLGVKVGDEFPPMEIGV